ncbi:MAG: ATP-grasp domain-containing protein, partial [Candidatus Hermodarchaeota archaeon]
MKSESIFIFEFVSGGGFNQVDIPSSLFCEGFGMLRSIIEDFKELDLEILTLLDYRISYLSNYLKADIIEPVNANDNYVISFKKLLKKSNFCFIIAPEFSNILYNLTKIVKDRKKKLLSVDLEAISIGSSKIKTFDFFRKYSVNTPETFQIPFKNGLDVDFINQKLSQFNSPIIIKPEDGVGAENIYYFENSSQIYNFFKESEFIIDTNRSYIVQKFIEGRDLS